MRTLILLTLVVSASACAGCGAIRLAPIQPSAQVTTPATVDHAAFDRILKTYVDERGMVDYAGLKASDALTPYLEHLAAIDPEGLSQDEALAFWMNVYNANTLKLIVDNYPTESITDLVPFAPLGLKVFVPKANSPFDQKFVRVGGRDILSLNNVEHGIIRSDFDDPRIHFALVCAAISCPPLRREAYVGARVDAQLDDQARTFLHDTSKNRIPSADGAARLSKILDWYGGDFGSNDAALQQYLARYFDGDVRAALEAGRYDLSYFSYDWSLNDQARAAR